MSGADTVVAAIDDLLQTRTGLCLGTLAAGRRDHVLQSAMRRCGTQDLDRYFERLRLDSQVFNDLVSELTVPETYFLRDPAQFTFLRDQVLPDLLRMRPADHILRLWSAGCASGEEAYSLAIVLKQAGLSRRTMVLASDISKPALERARRTCYGPWSLRGVPNEVIGAFFRKTPEGFQVDEPIARAVTFFHHNLAASGLPAAVSEAVPLDVIVCKNVFIYFARKSMRSVARRLVELLASGGWLFTGPSDPLLEVEDLCEVKPMPFGMGYQRRDEARPQERYSAMELRLPQQPASRPGRQASTSAHHASESAPKRHAATTTRRASSAANEEALRMIRQCANQLGSRAAEAACKKVLEREPLLAAAHCLHALLLLDLKREDEAKAALDRALFLDDSLAVGHFLSAMLAARRGDVVAARRAYLGCQARCSRNPPGDPVELGDGITYLDLEEAARRAVAMLAQRDETV